MVSPLSTVDYDRLRRHARTHREDLVVRLCGEAGLRPTEVAAFAPGDISDVDGTAVLALDDHATVLPSDLEHDVRKYVTSEGFDVDDRVVAVSPRRVQMLVREVADRAAAATDEDRFRDVSTQALREHFVLSQLRAGVDPRVVAEAAGFDSVAGIAPYLDEPSVVELAAAVGESAANGEFADVELPTELRAATALLESLAGTLADADSPRALFEAVVERAASVDGYRYAWVARRTDDDVAAVAHAGVDAAVVETDGRGHFDAADDDGIVESQTRDGDAAVREFRDGDGGVVSVRVAETEGSTYVLGIGVESAHRDVAMVALHEVTGALVGRAFEAVRRRRLLVADLVTELRFDVRDTDAVLPELAASLDATTRVDGVVPGGPGLVLYAEVGDTKPETVVDAVSDDERVDRVRYLDDGGTGPVFELGVGRSPAGTLVDLDARVTEYRADPGAATLVAAVSADADVRALVEATTDAHPGAVLVAQETVERSADTGTDFRGPLRDALTDRQFAVLQAAYHGGYFQWPRESTGEELADSLDVAAPTLHNHLRVAQSKLLDAFFQS